MADKLHKSFLALLFVVCAGVTLVVAQFGTSYYSEAPDQRPFHPQYDILKPSGPYGHGYGVVGSAMIAFGVAMYSSRKRIRALSGLGKIRYYLEFHIFLCLLGPILVLFHTTFKFGGLVAVSFWSMVAVVLSGIIGRYLYVQIPKGIHGNELSITDLAKENAALSAELSARFGSGSELLRQIDALAIPPTDPARMSVPGMLQFFVVSGLTRGIRLRKLFASLDASVRSHAVTTRMRQLVHHRIILTRRIAFLHQFRRLFYYWHVIHMPFALVMFFILLIHVAVAVAFGYTWTF